MKNATTSGDYVASATFSGAREGFKYTAGENGLGYYRDEPVVSGATEKRSDSVPEAVTKLKEKGNEMYKNGNLETAAEAFTSAIEVLDTVSPSQSATVARVSLLSNRAACWLYLRKYNEVEQDCNAVLKLEPGSAKAFYRRAMARRGLGRLFQAKSDLEVAAKKKKKEDRNIQNALEALEMEMGLPLCRTLKETIAPPPDPESHAVLRGDTVIVHASGFQQAGKQLFWSTHQILKHPETGEEEERGPHTFIVGRNAVIRGWDMGVVGMRVGEKRRLSIPAEEGYGNDGLPSWGLPPNVNLLYEVELLKVEPKPDFLVWLLGWLGGWKGVFSVLAVLTSFILVVISPEWSRDQIK